jgi:hypothetical protein
MRDKNTWNCTFCFSLAFMVCCIIKQKDNCIFTFKAAVFCLWNECQLDSVVRGGVMNGGSGQVYNFTNVLLKFYTF